MTDGTEVATAHGPVTEGPANHTASCSAYQEVGETWMIGVAVLATYCSDVPSIGASFGSPSIFGGSIFASATFTSAIWGITLAMRASFACAVPATAAFTFSFSLSSGIFAKSAGSASLATYSHGPSKDAARNQRPEMST